jgi:hypothetical protein
MSFTDKPMTFEERLTKVRRIMRTAGGRNDWKVATRELGEAIEDLVTALWEREQALKALYNPPPSPPPSASPAPPKT